MDDEITPVHSSGDAITSGRRKLSLRTHQSQNNEHNDDVTRPDDQHRAHEPDDLINENPNVLYGQSLHADKDWVAPSRIGSLDSILASRPASSVLNKPITKKRVYRYVTRLCRPRKLSKMRTGWIKILEKTDEYLSSLLCCSSMKCFSRVDIPFLREKMSQYLSASTCDRKRLLCSLATSDGEFVFDGNVVCSQFLRKAFRFSLEVQAAGRRIPSSTRNNIPSGVVNTLMSMNSSRQGSSSSDNNSTTSIGGSQDPIMKDYIITFIDRLVDNTADSMPDNGELHLPFFRKDEVYGIFKSEYKTLYPTRETPSQSYFLHIWQKERSKVKIRQNTRFTKCNTCERLRSAKAEAIRKGLPTDHIKREQAVHNEFIAKERREYLRKAELAMLHPSRYLSVVIDGADQSAYSIPHFITKLKTSKGEGLKVHLIGALQHLPLNRLRLFTMTDDHETGSNHIVECLHRFINDVGRGGCLPRTLFVQLDNCVRENKNHYLLAYIDALVRWSVFDCIEVGFLPIGHTHCDVDQEFSSTSDRLKYHDACLLYTSDAADD